MRWREMSQTMPVFDIGMIFRSSLNADLTDEVISGYEAPFPDESYKAGARILPALVPISPDDPAAKANRELDAQTESFHQMRDLVFNAPERLDALTRRLYRFGLSRDEVLSLYAFIDWVMTLPEPLEDDYHRATDEVQKSTDGKVEQIDEILEAKQKEILET